MRFSFASCPLEAPVPQPSPSKSRIPQWLEGLRSQSAPTSLRVIIKCKRSRSVPLIPMSSYDTGSRSPTSFSVGSSPSKKNSSRNTNKEKDREEKLDTNSSTYREEVLKRNDIFYVNTTALPSTIDAEVQRIAYAKRNSPPISDELAQQLALQCRGQMDEPKQSYTVNFIDPNFTTSPCPYPNSTVTRQLGWYPATVPRNMNSTITPKTPAPDVAYGYCEESYSSYQKYAIEQNDIYRYTQVSNDLSLPFFLWEIKSQCTGGSVYQAATQCITGGSAMVGAALALEWLIEKMTGRPSEPIPTGSIAFSVAVDNINAQLHVHWYSSEALQYRTKCVETFSLWTAQGISDLQRVTKNILQWGYQERHNSMTQHLNTLFNATPAPQMKGHKRTLDWDRTLAEYDKMRQEYDNDNATSKGSMQTSSLTSYPPYSSSITTLPLVDPADNTHQSPAAEGVPQQPKKRQRRGKQLKKNRRTD